MSYITTVTGKHFDPMNPEKQEFDIIDIAHALSLICRGNGHITAQHRLCRGSGGKRMFNGSDSRLSAA